jgi:hypothetical protein
MQAFSTMAMPIMHFSRRKSSDRQTYGDEWKSIGWMGTPRFESTLPQ